MTSQLAEVPPLETSEMQADTRGSAEFLPQQLLLTLATNPASSRALPKPSNVWNFQRRRERLRHLTDSTVCVCGAGKDVAFLYDLPAEPKTEEEQQQQQQQHEEEQEQQQQQQHHGRRQRRKKQQEAAGDSRLPDSLQPAEFQLVRHRGAQRLQFTPDEHSTQPRDHDRHLTVFPSMKPTSRLEVLQLSKSFNQLLAGVGVGEAFSATGPTQMHRLLDLVKKEQDVYNVATHELVRQLTVECVERGELLAQIRNAYRAVLVAAPLQVKHLHDEAMAQRALDRRLTEELLRFRTRIGSMTSELSGVKNHEIRAVAGTKVSQEKLHEALADAKRTADLLHEYHGLYELQRRRLERQVEQLASEQKLWTSVSYALAVGVAMETEVTLCQRLHETEKSWRELAVKYTSLLSEKDAEDLDRVGALVETWRDRMEAFSARLTERDGEIGEAMRELRERVAATQETFEDKYFTEPTAEQPGGRLKRALTLDETSQVLSGLREWETLLNRQTNSFGGDVMLELQEATAAMRRLTLTWTDTCVGLFARHKAEDGAEFPEKRTMHSMTSLIDRLMRQLTVRLTGENGVARGVITLQNILETWVTRLQASLNTQKPLPEQEWTRFHALCDDWLNIVDETLAAVGSCDVEDAKEPQKPLDPSLVAAEVAKWSGKTASGIQSEDTRLAESVAHLRTCTLRWLIQSLLRLAPDLPGNSPEARQAALSASATVEELLKSFKEIGEWLVKFTVFLSDSCSVIVNGIVSQRLAAKDEDFDFEQRELVRFKTEASTWCSSASSILVALGADPAAVPDPTVAANISRDPRLPTQSTIASLGSAQPEDSLLALVARESTTQEAEEEKEDEGLATPAAVQDPEASTDNDFSEFPAAAAAAAAEQETVTAVEQTTAEADETEQTETEQTEAAEQTEAEQTEAEQTETAEQQQPPPEEIVEAIGSDLNVHSRPLSQPAEASLQDRVQLEPGVRAVTPDADVAFATLAQVQELQMLLAETEARAAEAEEAEAASRLRRQAAADKEKEAREMLEAAKQRLLEAKTPPPPPEKKPELLEE